MRKIQLEGNFSCRRLRLVAAGVSIACLLLLCGIGESLTVGDLILPSDPPQSHSLAQFQTSVKDQSWRGSCAAHAFIGALEAAYIRKYGYYPGSGESGRQHYWSYGGITNDCGALCLTPPCDCEEFNLSEEYFIHIVHTTQHANGFDSTPSYCTCLSNCIVGDTLSSDFLPGEFISASLGLTVPLEKYAPFFGGLNDNLYAYGTRHKKQDYEGIAASAGLLSFSGGQAVCNAARTQEQIDAFEYDPRHIPLEARKKAVYGPTEVLLLSESHAQDTSLLEKIVASGSEVYMELGVSTAKLLCSFQLHTDGNVKCGKSGDYAFANGPDHVSLLIGYDRNIGFLFKNSWGPTSTPYYWVSYDWIKIGAKGGAVIMDIRNPSLGPSNEAMWLGEWDMDYDGNFGKLVIRRTRETTQKKNESSYDPSKSVQQARAGTFYDSGGVAYKVSGSVFADGSGNDFFIDFDDPGDTPGTPFKQHGQFFKFVLFSSLSNPFTFGEYAAGFTQWNFKEYGALMSRSHPRVALGHVRSESFDASAWQGKYRLHYYQGSAVSVDIATVAAASGQYNPVLYFFRDFPSMSPGTAGIFTQSPNHLDFFTEPLGLNPAQPYSPLVPHDLFLNTDLFYHTWEKGIVSGAGVFGLRLMPPPAAPTWIDYVDTGTPVLSYDIHTAKPLGVRDPTARITFGMMSIHFALIEQEAPVDIYLGIHAKKIDPVNIYLIGADGVLHPHTVEVVKWKEGVIGPVDEKLFGDIPIGSLPTGTYDFFVLLTPAGSFSPYTVWHTTLSSVIPVWP